MDDRPEMEAKFVLGVQSIDRQHRGLFEILGRVYDALASNDFSAGPTIRGAVAELIQRTAEHFASEEAVMAAARYPALSAHQSLHRDLMAQAREVETRAEAAEQFAPTELASFLHAWLTDHILAEDKAFTEFLLIGEGQKGRPLGN